MAREQEIKLSVGAASWPEIEDWLENIGASPQPAKSLQNTYFDTSDCQLNRRKIALRIRHDGERYIQTLKTKGAATRGLHDRQEWEWPLSTPQLDTEVLRETPVGQVLAQAQLRPFFSTDFVRTAWLWQEGSQTVEFALDEGEVLSGGNLTGIREVELELKGGAISTLLSLADTLSRLCPVFVDTVSKAEKGYFLAGINRPAPADLYASTSWDDSLDAWLVGLSLLALTGRGEFLQQAMTALELLRKSDCQSVGAPGEAPQAQRRKLTPEQWQALGEIHANLIPGAPDKVLSQLLGNPIVGQCQLQLIAG